MSILCASSKQAWRITNTSRQKGYIRIPASFLYPPLLWMPVKDIQQSHFDKKSINLSVSQSNRIYVVPF